MEEILPDRAQSIMEVPVPGQKACGVLASKRCMRQVGALIWLGHVRSSG